MHLPCIYHERAIHAFCMRVHVHVPRLRLCMHVQAEPKKEKKQRTATAAEKSLAQQNKEVLADSGSQVSRLPEGRGEARAGGARQRGAVAQGRGVQLPSQRRSGRRGRRGGSHGRPGAASAAAGPCQQLRARCAGRELSPCVGPLARRACEARLRGAPSADSAPRLCLRQAKKRLSFLLGQSELFKHFGLKDVKPPLTLAPS